MRGKVAILWLASALLLRAAPASAMRHLRPGQTVDLVLDSQRPINLAVDAGPNQAVTLLVDQDEPSLRLRLLSEDGQEIRAVSTGFSGIFQISPAPTGEGRFIVEVSAGQPVRTPAALTVSAEAMPAGDTVGADPPEAEELFLQGQRLRSQPKAGAIRQAIELFRQARERWRDAHRRSGEALALLAEGDARLQLSQYRNALRAYAAGRLLAPPDSRLAARLLNAESVVDLELWKRDEARAAAEQALTLARGIPDRRAEAGALTNLAIAKYLFVEADTAAALQAALDAATARGNRLAAARALTAQGWVEKDLGHNGRAIERMEEAARLFQETGRTLDALSDMVDIAATERLRGDAYSAVVTHGKLVKLFQEAGNIYNQATADEHIGADYIALKRARDALPYIREARRLFVAAGTHGTRTRPPDKPARSNYPSIYIRRPSRTARKHVGTRRNFIYRSLSRWPIPDWASWRRRGVALRRRRRNTGARRR